MVALAGEDAEAPQRNDVRAHQLVHEPSDVEQNVFLDRDPDCRGRDFEDVPDLGDSLAELALFESQAEPQRAPHQDDCGCVSPPCVRVATNGGTSVIDEDLKSHSVRVEYGLGQS